MRADIRSSTDEYGPCVGVPRLQRWERAHALGLNPPPEVAMYPVTHPPSLLNHRADKGHLIDEGGQWGRPILPFRLLQRGLTPIEPIYSLWCACIIDFDVVLSHVMYFYLPTSLLARASWAV